MRRDRYRTGGWLIFAGYLGLYVTLALDFPKLWRQLGEIKQVPGGPRGFRRVTRQINGKETYRTDEIEYLRWHAERRVADGRFALTAWGPVVSLIVLFTGLALTPPRRLPTSSDDLHAFTLITDGLNVIGPVLRIFAAVAALAFVAALVVAWRLQGDPKAKAFLERTRPLTPDPFT